MPHVAVVLSGCGHLDGSEIHESVITLLHLVEQGATYEGLAPDRPQHHVMNHFSKEPMPDERNMLTEAARIVRGNIKSLADANLDDYDAVIFPGGFGAAKNLFDLAFAGPNYQLKPDILAFLKKAVSMRKPMGFICIAPMMIPHVYPKGVKMTIGHDPAMAELVEHLGAKHVPCEVNECVLDAEHRVVSTPAYMLAKDIGEVSHGICELVKTVLELALHA
ncbi:MAG: isoprenoid biosynthesis protein ElbB [Gammaproteobacteria bacterium]|nr:isoprenoid biosynthesis protein ElbB [Gammaproteobacteria bacterium]